MRENKEPVHVMDLWLYITDHERDIFQVLSLYGYGFDIC